MKEEKSEESGERPKPTDNIIRVGQKPLMNYVVACITFFNAGEKEIVVQARGQAISRAVDIVELLRRAFVKDLKVKDINLGTQEIFRTDGRKSNVSTIEIYLSKPVQ